MVLQHCQCLWEAKKWTVYTNGHNNIITDYRFYLFNLPFGELCQVMN